MLAKWLATRPRVLILDEPTRGVDMATRVDIYRIVDRLARDGLAVLLISSDLTEVIGASDRLLVMNAGPDHRRARRRPDHRGRSADLLHPRAAGAATRPLTAESADTAAAARLVVAGRDITGGAGFTLLIAALVLVAALTTDVFLSPTNLTNLLKQMVTVGCCRSACWW